MLLEEQAFPFEEKAIEIHEANARRAAEGVYDEWVQKSYTALAELKPARYARTEVDPPPAAPRGTGSDRGDRAGTPVAPAVTEQLAAARVSLEAGRVAEALPMLECRARNRSGNADGQNRLGIAYRRLGKFTEARAAYERAIAADPQDAAPRRNLAVLLDLYLWQPVAALEQYEKYQATERRRRRGSDRVGRRAAQPAGAGATHRGGAAMKRLRRSARLPKREPRARLRRPCSASSRGSPRARCEAADAEADRARACVRNARSDDEAGRRRNRPDGSRCDRDHGQPRAAEGDEHRALEGRPSRRPAPIAPWAA